MFEVGGGRGAAEGGPRSVSEGSCAAGRGDAGADPRFVVTSLAAAELCGRTLDEDADGGRGEMKNRINECPLDLVADPAA